MNWLLFLKYIDDKYHIVQAGSDIVPTEDFDKVLPTTERIARQSDKVYFDGEKLKLKDGETLLSVEELNELKESPLEEELKQTQPVIFDID
ncbi:hypothetical protein BUY43_01780 [Staphylococcus devriesei]|uniref:Uncharacterized protein n=1 Tax=Staphylococcus devriesei TaxID=586733 RepID=A0A2K4DHC7_9STAP|nr:hypothetical protein [Staphylococcus devriesei]MCE5096515.1 hypothetical protein [Staphylococcus devriesei]PNZ86265.1 hypothetical protein CD147_10325 [Staphylococcus devriesei]PTE70878.1 hypothetical protein BUY44_10485 [Staphylococcus devriesei]PTF04326.1 hypothetical protein BUY45_03985 [Staphylococcus devriesei]PTF15159.1 hypothetical protein BUY48_06685 [Staphylococcus devriesei]